MSHVLLSKLKQVLALSLLVVNLTAIACINDSDAKFFEAQKFPSATELASGDFITHSKEFYEWRAKDRLEKLKKEPENLAYYDDLAVSYEKSGQTQKAIDTLEQVYSKHPDRYETLANLGTFYIHNKQYKKGVELLKKAVDINPAAHFGRETYQIKVVEYILKENPDEKFTLPVQKSSESFADFILKDVKPNAASNGHRGLDPSVIELLKASVGIGGMLKFGNSDSPVLLEAMGDIYMKLHELNKNRADKEGRTSFSRFASLYYLAALTRHKSPNNVPPNNNNNVDEQYEKYASLKKLPTIRDVYDKAASLNTLVETAQKNKEEYRKKELAFIEKGGDVEQAIYTKLYAPPTEQEDLLETAITNYKSILKDTAEITHNKRQEDAFSALPIIMILLGLLFWSLLGTYASILVVSNESPETHKFKRAFKLSAVTYVVLNIMLYIYIVYF